MEKKKSKKFILPIFLLLVVLILGIAYAYLRTALKGEKKYALTSGNLSLVLDENASEGINIADASPMPDAQGETQDTYFSFSLVNNGSIRSSYTLYLDDDVLDEGDTRVDATYVHYSLDKDHSKGKSKSLLQTRVIDQGNIEQNTTIQYKLRLWFVPDLPVDTDGQVFAAKLRVEAIQDQDIANAPELATNMIPVRYDGSNWVKADTSDTWYDYKKQEWANAVTVSEASRSNYLSADANTPISMDDINTMWVWLPRYSYTIGSEDGTNYYGKQGEYLDTTPTKALPGEIDVRFVGTNIKETGSAKYKVSEGVSGWRTPDGFTFGDKELPGIWVAKFETSNQEASYTSDNSNLTPIVKPKVTSWGGARVSTMETVAMNMTKENNIYGLSANEVDSHMMKNSEWALAAYLSQSRYGKLGNENYTGSNKQIYNNNYRYVKTGCSSGAPTAGGSDICSFEYDNLTDRGSGTGSGGGGASTTGNIYGIYDMSGGSWEYVMGNYNNYSGYTSRSYTIEEAKELLGKDITSNVGLWNSGYSGPTGYDNQVFEGLPFPEGKYYDLYTTNSTSTACNGKVCTSHALSEVAGWYEDNVAMISLQKPWLLRGGGWNYGRYAGVFGFDEASGAAFSTLSFRPVLTQ